jgi:alkanesulfonate monooxygenase SsuD/methylene tetrahydromethanopterin reductase-like flavin-dependent oxidoreductase (luciferase family)
MDVCLMVEGQEDVTWGDWLALAAACEKNGVGTMFRSDHYLSVDDRRERGSLDAWGTIAALGAVTEKLRLGTMVSPATFRHPSVLAKLAVTADHVSGGRVEVGIGAGWWEREHELYGFELPEIGPRMERSKSRWRSSVATGASGLSISTASTTRCASSTPSRSRCSSRCR